jgi:hypothetical protein
VPVLLGVAYRALEHPLGDGPTFQEGREIVEKKLDTVEGLRELIALAPRRVRKLAEKYERECRKVPPPTEEAEVYLLKRVYKVACHNGDMRLGR